jgi:hypothetical protein
MKNLAASREVSTGHFFIVGASLLAKFFASKLAPTGGFWPDDCSGIKPESGSIIRRKRRGIRPEEINANNCASFAMRLPA